MRFEDGWGAMYVLETEDEILRYFEVTLGTAKSEGTPISYVGDRLEKRCQQFSEDGRIEVKDCWDVLRVKAHFEYINTGRTPKDSEKLVNDVINIAMETEAEED